MDTLPKISSNDLRVIFEEDNALALAELVDENPDRGFGCYTEAVEGVYMKTPVCWAVPYNSRNCVQMLEKRGYILSGALPVVMTYNLGEYEGKVSMEELSGDEIKFLKNYAGEERSGGDENYFTGMVLDHEAKKVPNDDLKGSTWEC
jgi:hypothetical protein